MKGFDGKRAIVTGAAQGIGFSIVEELLKVGARVILNDFDAEYLSIAREKLSDYSGLICHQGDASKKNTADELVARSVEQFGGLDVAVANAGLTVMGKFLDFPEDQLRKMLDLNLAGSFLLAQASARQMIAQNSGGRILFMSSVTGIQAHQDTEGYGMTKAALRMLTKDLGVQLAPHGITVNGIAPGATLTERTLSETGYAEAWGNMIPTGKASTPEDIARACLFFLGPDSGQITGQTLVVDGGWTSVSPLPPELYD
jgi:3-oxoacyl-[acyl-carrier protein] reductase